MFISLFSSSLLRESLPLYLRKNIVIAMANTPTVLKTTATIITASLERPALGAGLLS